MNLKFINMLKSEIINKRIVKISFYRFFNNEVSVNTLIFV